VVAHLLRLRLDLVVGIFRRDPVHAAGMVLILVVGLGLAIGVAVGLTGLAATTPDIARATIVVVGSIIVLGFLLLPLAFGVDDMLDPRRFRLLDIAAGPLASGLAVAGLVSVPVAMVGIIAIAQVVTWARGPLPVLFAILGAIILVPTCVLAARVSSGIASTFLATRRSRDATGVVLWFLLALTAPLAAIVATLDWESRALPVLRRLTAVLGWTPLGATWAMPGDAATGHPDIALAKLAIAVGFLVVLAAAWRLLVGVVLRRNDREVEARSYSGLGWFERLPATPRSVIAARSLSYWARDRRYRVALAAIPVLPLVIIGALVVGGVPASTIAWVPVPVMCLFLGWLVHNDLAHDSTAFWLHVSSDTRGSDDRWGRLVPPLFIGVPLATIGSVVTAAVVGDWVMLPALIGLSLCVLLVALGISSVTSAAFPYPAVHPGNSPFAQPQAVGNAGSLVQAFSLILALVAATPVVLFIVLGTLASPVWFLAALGAGLVIGITVLLLGVRSGASIITRQSPELLAFTLQN
jgi:ABC-2 type transport system permease protein